MRRIPQTLLALHQAIRSYAKTLTQSAELEAADVDDLISDAYLQAQSRLGSVQVRKCRAKAIQALARSELSNALNRRDLLDERMQCNALRLDCPDDAGEFPEIGVPDPLRRAAASAEWRTMTQLQAESERGDCRRLVTLLMKPGMTMQKAMTITGFTRRKIYAIKEKLKLHFAQCFQAYCECQRKFVCTRNRNHLVYISGDQKGPQGETK